jgi:hypothetical protein
MRRMMVALGLLIGLAAAATAGTLHGMSGGVSAFDNQAPVVRAACGFDDRFCPYGRTRQCSPDGRCWCASCGRPRYLERRFDDGPRYYNEPRGNDGLNFQLFGGRSDDRRYAPPNKAQFRTFNGCPNGYTVQDGLCKPYTGR